MADISVTVWNEYRHEKTQEVVAKIYPRGIHAAIADHLNRQPGIKARTATLDEADHGLTDEVLASTDVLVWWGHKAHHEVREDIAFNAQYRVLNGMGLIALHSAHFSKVFTRLMGTTCALKWREEGEKERLWVTSPGHPIADGLREYFELDHEETYGEHFDIPEPDNLVLVSWFSGGDVFRSGCCYYRGKGKIFYFRPGHETHPTYYNPDVLKVITNAVRWAAPVKGPILSDGLERVSLEKMG